MITKFTTIKDIQIRLVISLLILLVFGLFLMVAVMDSELDLQFLYQNLYLIIIVFTAVMFILFYYLKSRRMINSVYVDIEINKENRTINLHNSTKQLLFSDIEAYIRDDKHSLTAFLAKNKVYVYTDELFNENGELMNTVFCTEELGFEPYKKRYKLLNWFIGFYFFATIGLIVYTTVSNVLVKDLFLNNLYIPYSIAASFFVSYIVLVQVRLFQFKKAASKKLI